MPDHPFRLPLGKDALTQIGQYRSAINGVLIDPATDPAIGPSATFNNDTDPVNMEGQRGIGILFKASQAAHIQLFAAEETVDVNGKITVRDIYPIKDTSGNNIIQTLTAGVSVCVFYPDLLAEYVVVRGTNDATSANTIYLRIY